MQKFDLPSKLSTFTASKPRHHLVQLDLHTLELDLDTLPGKKPSEGKRTNCHFVKWRL